MQRGRDEADGGDLWEPLRERLVEIAGPLPEGTTSLFGPMFSADHDRAIADLFAAAGPHGTIAFTAFTPLGVVGRLLRLASQLDPPPAGGAPALAWGREERLRQDLERWADAPRFVMESIELRFASSADALARLCRALPPLLAVPDQEGLRAAAAPVVEEAAMAAGDGIVLPVRYLIALARRRSS